MATTTTTGPGTALAPTTAPPPGTVARQEFGARELQVSGEMAAAAAAAQAQAVVQARYVMATQRPRDWDDVRVRLMREVERPGFAEVAWFRKPIGQGVEGFSIRFAEAAMRCMGNLLPEAPIIYDDPHRRVLRVSVTDLESNLTWTKDVVIEKTVERRTLRRGQVALSVRQNSQGDTTYLVEATEDDLLAKEGAVVSKTTRTHALRILPGDIQDEARRRILEIRSGAAAKDPEGTRRKVVTAFAELNVMPSDLKRYLGHDVAAAGPAELQELRDLYSAIKDGSASWAEALAERVGEQQPAEGTAPAAAKPGLAGLTEKLQAQPTPTQQPTKGCDHQVVANDLDTCPPTSVVTCRTCGEEVPGRLTQAAADQLAAAQERVPDAAEPGPSKAKSTNSGKGQGQRKLEE